MHLIQIDVVRLETAQAGLHFAPNVDPCGAAVIEIGVAHRQTHLGRQYDILADSLQRMTDQGFALAATVDIGGVDEVNALVQSKLDHLTRGVLIQIAHVHAPPELHRAKRHGAHDET